MKTNKLFMKMAISAIAGTAIITVIIYVTYLSHKGFVETSVSQTQNHLLSTLKVIAKELHEFIIHHQEALQVLSNDPLIKEKIYNKVQCKENDYGGKFCQVENFYEAYNKHVDALTIIDANGMMLDREPFWKDNKNRIGWDHSDKSGIACVLREHKPCVSEILYNNLGNLAVSISEPVFYKDKFAGIVRWMIETDTISKNFIEPVKIGKNGFVWMFDNKNRVLSHPRKDFVGLTVLDVVKKMHKERGEVFDESRINEHIIKEHDYLNKVNAEEEGCGIFINCDTNENDIIAYKSVAAENLILNLIVTMPYSEITGPINKHAREIFSLAGFIVIILSTGGLVVFRSQKEKARLETEAKYLKQIANGAEALRESEERFRTIASTANDAIIMIDNEANVSYWNPAAEEMLGYTKQEVIGRELHKVLIPDRYYESYKKGFGKFKETGKGSAVDKTLDLAAIRKDGTEFPIELSMSAIKIKGKWHAVGIIRDTTLRKKMEEKLRLLSNSDGLTGIANRRYFDEIFDREWKRALRDAVPISLIMCDIDYFKAYNDTYGHQSGDDVLKRVANEINKTMKRPGDLAARYGGEEFVVLLPNTDLKGAAALAEDIRKNVEAMGIQHKNSKAGDVLSISLGVANRIPDRISYPANLLSMADRALYRAKEEGRNRVYKAI